MHDYECSRLTLALSGGGHRASILAMGGLMALVDRGLNRRVDVIASVSGGSLTNGVLAQACDFAALQPGELDNLADTFVERVRDRPLFSSSMVVFALIGTTAAIVGAMWRSPWDDWWSWGPVFGAWSLLFAIPVFLALALLTGRLLLIAIQHRHFPGKPKLSALTSRSVSHEFCTTDLRSGMPVVFSSGKQEARRWSPLSSGTRGWEVTGWDAADKSIAAVVRASAAFPGIAPKAFRFRQQTVPVPTRNLASGGETAAPKLGRVALCADGGIWNNLGSHAVREQGTSHGPALLCMNASAPARATGWWEYFVPGLANAMGLYRTMTILNRNTVEPRVDGVTRELERRSRTGQPPDYENDPLTVIADMRRIEHALAAIRRLARDDGSLTESGTGRAAVTRDEVNQLDESEGMRALLDADPNVDVAVPTTFAKLEAEDVFVLLLRGYVGTWLASLYFEPLRDGELTSEAAACVLHRLEGIARR